MTIEIKINYHWNLGDDVKQEHKELLEENAIGRIFDMMEQGYTSGELIEEYDDNTYYRGWFTISKEWS